MYVISRRNIKNKATDSSPVDGTFELPLIQIHTQFKLQHRMRKFDLQASLNLNKTHKPTSNNCVK